MLSFVTFKYLKPGYRTVYTAEHVNALSQMVARHYKRAHQFFCVTDDPAGLDSDINYVPMWGDHFELVNPSHPTSRPNCYPRLKLFSPEMRDIFGERFVSLDLDMVMVGDVSPIFDRPEPFVIYDARGDDHYNGSIFMQTAGAHPEIWEDFCPVRSPQLTTAANMKGSDQAWIRYKLSPRAATWSYEEGVYAYLNLVPPRRQLRRGIVQTHGRRPYKHTHGPAPAVRDGSLPKNARIVVFAGEYKPWEARTQEISPWIRTYYPLAGR